MSASFSTNDRSVFLRTPWSTIVEGLGSLTNRRGLSAVQFVGLIPAFWASPLERAGSEQWLDFSDFSSVREPMIPSWRERILAWIYVLVRLKGDTKGGMTALPAARRVRVGQPGMEKSGRVAGRWSS